MITRAEQESMKKAAAALLAQAEVTVRPQEIEEMEVADFGLGEVRTSGAQIVTLVITERISAKLVVLLPGQTLPEHAHPPIGDNPGKEETIRCEWGELYLYGPGKPAANPKGSPPEARKDTYTVWHEYALGPGDQVTFTPGTPHWFSGGPLGCVAWSFSSKAVDVKDVFTDPEVKRTSVIGG